MRFFRSRLADVGYQAADGRVYFVSSERNRGMGVPYPRFYTVRCLTGPKGDIKTVGEFQQYTYSRGADTAARRLAVGAPDPTCREAMPRTAHDALPGDNL
jgi:hypothetical protein